MTLTLKTRWMLSIAVSVTISLIILGFTTLFITKNAVHAELLQEAEQNLSSQKVLVKSKITSYFSTIESQLVTMAKSAQTTTAANDFINGFYQYENLTSDSINSRNVNDYYEKEFARVYYESTDERKNASQLTAKLDRLSTALQADYIANNSYKLGAKDLLNQVGNGTAYDNAHREFHPDFSSFVSAFKFYDLFIVDAKRGDVVYSVFKEVDFATNLQNGSFSQSGLAEAYENAKTLNQGESYLTDFSSYKPSYEAPAGFMSSPIFDNGDVVAVLILQMPIDTINNIMIQDSKWQESGFGYSGEVYLVGADKTLRSQSRLFAEDRSAYLKMLERMGKPEVSAIKAKGTTITLQKVNSESARNALEGLSGFEVIEDYRGIKVLSAYSPIKFGNLSWGIISEIDEEEALESAYALEKALIITTAFSVIALTTVFALIALVMASKLINPLVIIGKHFKDLTDGDADLTVTVPQSRIPEINAISESFNTFVTLLKGIINDVKSNALTIASASEELSVSTAQSSRAAKYQQIQASEVMKAVVAFDTSISSVSDNSNAASKGMTEAQQRAFDDSSQSSRAAENICRLVTEVNESAATILQLKDEVQNINDVLVVINGIADQTNLLALNAAIEAARAGEHGRGFSVVADEVRTLASSTQKSTVDIQNKIKTLTTVAGNAVSSMERASKSATQGVELVQDVSKGLNEMSRNIENLAQINQQVANSSLEQTTTSRQISQNIEGVSSASDQLSVAAGESTQAAQELADISSRLQQLVERFKT